MRDVQVGRIDRAQRLIERTAQLAGIYAELDRLEPVAAKGPSLRPREERYAWPLGLALLLGALAWLWPERRR